ncbi:DNA internalization-related competence protein ComEC/Rec2 [Budvicia diplopodorum]|uniref:DNA internalization-related competence protein ComEC/Rec2 n=1 Tax=Budvicia diplopodorum TaxID=1119056 RepID=UPI0013581FE0|nr:DNA internalization-related competence protein ComEC/Rec2 [Budvicia diplopodorum]
MHSAISFDHIAAAIIAGMLPLLFISSLPSAMLWIIIAGAAVFAAISGRYPGRLIALMLVSFLWGVSYAERLYQQVDYYSDKKATVSGTVISAGMGSERSPKVVFRISQVDGVDLSYLETIIIPLYFNSSTKVSAPEMLAGQQWRLRVLFRPVHSQLNVGSYDKQRRAMANHQLIIGYVNQAELLSPSVSLRQRVITQVYKSTLRLKSQDIIFALAFGERGKMVPERSQLLLQTGTAHLMAISGLHISLAALVGWLIARGVQFLFATRYIGLVFPQVISWGTAALYVWLSGANPPAVRAFMALTLWMILRWQGANWTTWQIWLRIIAMLLLFDPMMILSDSLWLSCCAVAALIFWFQWVPLPGAMLGRRWIIIQWVYLQLAMMILLIPMQTIIFHGLSWTAIVSNLIAVPLVSLITVPAILLGLIFCWFPHVASPFWRVADQSLLFVLSLLERLQNGWVVMTYHVIGLSFLGWLIIIYWRMSLWQSTRFTPWVLLVVVIFPAWNRAPELWRIDMLDIGHGLAIVIRRGNQAILYDTGNSWPGSSMAQREILPFLRWQGITLEGVILSHDHQDHAGGLDDILAAYPKIWLRSSSLRKGLSCQQGDSWQWQGLNFTAIWPLERREHAFNADSCVIRISDGQHSVLLTGDLERAQELKLVESQSALLASDILQTPHHGSNTSSTASFIRAVNPAVTLTSVSRFNQWGLPSLKVRQRYNNAKIKWHSTAKSGQVSVLFYKDYYDVLGFREQLMPRWYHQRFGSLRHNE